MIVQRIYRSCGTCDIMSINVSLFILTSLQVSVLSKALDGLGGSCQGPLDCNGRECLDCSCENSICVCKDGWSGDHCQTPFCVNRSTCSNHGNCKQTVHNINCDCDTGYAGPRCKTATCSLVRLVKLLLFRWLPLIHMDTPSLCCSWHYSQRYVATAEPQTQHVPLVKGVWEHGVGKPVRFTIILYPWKDYLRRCGLILRRYNSNLTAHTTSCAPTDKSVLVGAWTTLMVEWPM